jgi:hypothetical protein
MVTRYKFKRIETGSNLPCSKQDDLWVLAAAELCQWKELAMLFWSKTEHQAILRCSFALGFSVDQCLEDMAHHTTIFRCYREFQRGNFSLEDASRWGRPASSVTENIAAVRKMLMSDRHVTYWQKSIWAFLHRQVIPFCMTTFKWEEFVPFGYPML